MGEVEGLAPSVRQMSGTTAVLRACAELLARPVLDATDVAALSATIAARAEALQRSLDVLLAQLDG